MNIKSRIFSLWRCNQGVAHIEFAFVLPVLLLLMLGTIELTRYILIVQKVEKTVAEVTDVTTQADPNTTPLTTSTMSQLMSAVVDMMSPYGFGSNGLVIVTDVQQSGASNPVINWQYCGGGTLSAISHIGTSNGGAATLPAGFTMVAGEEVVIGEVFYQYSPILPSSAQQVMLASTIYRTAIYMPRLGALSDFSSTCP